MNGMCLLGYMRAGKTAYPLSPVSTFGDRKCNAYEYQREKKYLLTCAPTEDSNQPVHTHKKRCIIA